MAPSYARLVGCAVFAAVGTGAWSQTQTVTVTGRSLPEAPAVTGFGDQPLGQAPFSAASFGSATLRDAGARQLSDLTRLDASIGDAYNAEGYWSILSVRGYTLDNRYNYRRDGLPINAETALPLANKERVDVLEGTSGIQAGTSAPGGLVDLVVKRPTGTVRSAFVEMREGGSIATALDVGQRFGTGDAFGLRVNAAYEHLDPQTRDARGERQLLSAAADWRAAPGTLLEAEVESSRQSQPSVPGFSLLGNRVPDAKAIDPRINLNDQPWSQPVVLRGDTASLRWQQRLSDDWRFTAHGMTQRLASDDRIAFPFGCSAEDAFDRYCSDGTFDLYDFRSDGERRRTDALDLAFAGRARTGPVEHQITAGLLLSRFEARFGLQAFNYAGVGTIDGETVVPAAPEASSPQTDRDERNREFYLRDAVALGADWRLWAGVRHTRLHRGSIGTDGSAPTDYVQTATLPWLAVSRSVTPETTLYASWGEGLESDVAPNLPQYDNAGQPLPALKSRQAELGVKHGGRDVQASLAAFDIRRPQSNDGCTGDGDAQRCIRRSDGDARHRGVEAAAAGRYGAWEAGGSAMWLDAKRLGSADASIDGRRPTNVPRTTLRGHLGYTPPAWPALTLSLDAAHESDRMVLPDNSARIPAWTRWDLGLRWRQRTDAAQLTWRIGIDNVTDTRAWKEAPYQFDHVYLFPLAPRTLRASVQADL